jgi:hypothetical protein
MAFLLNDLHVFLKNLIALLLTLLVTIEPACLVTKVASDITR